MQRTFAGLMGLILVLVSSLAWAANDAADSPDVDTLVDGLQERYAQVTDFKADFRQVVTRKHLPRPLKKSGKVYFKRPGMMRWDYLQPDRVYYISNGEILWSYEPAEKVAYKLAVKESELYSALKFLFGQGDLKRDFIVSNHDGDEAGPAGTKGLVLTPKVAQSNYKRLILHIDAATFEIKQTELVDPLDNVSVITFSDSSYELRDPAGFEFTPPKGVKIDDRTGGALSTDKQRGNSDGK